MSIKDPVALLSPESAPGLSAVQSDQLERCIQSVLSCYDQSPDIQGILTRMPRKAGRVRLDDLEAFFKKLELDADRDHGTIADVQMSLVPAIIVFEDGSSAAFLPTLKKGGDFFIPDGQALSEHAVTGIEAIFYIKPPEAMTRMATLHMKWGHTLDWFWQPVVDFWKQYSEILICSLFINLFVFALPLFSMNVYDRVAVNFSRSTLIVLTAGIVLALLFDFMLKTLRAYVLEHVASRVGSKFDMDLMERLMSIKPTAMHLSLGEKTNIFRELQGIKDFYASRLAPSLIDVPFFFLFVGVVYMLSPVVAIVPITAAIVILLINLGLQIPINRATKAYFSSLQNKSTVLVQTLAGMDTIKMLGATGTKLFQWNISTNKSIEASRQNSILTSISANLCIMITYLINVFVLFIGVYEISQGNLTVGGLVACTTLSSRSISPIVSLSGLIMKLKQSNDVLKAIDRIYQLPHEDENLAQTSAKGPFKGKIQLQNVYYQYKDQPRPALNNASLLIQPGEHVGLIGKTGSGKSTLIKMICRFIDPQEGNIFLDDHALDSISSEELRRSIGFVPQDSFFFSGSIRHNIILGNDTISPATLQEVLEISGLDVILHNAGMGLDAEVGEGGGRLSGGQKQAVALARALVRQPSILVFDEPINGIDSSLEVTIKQNLSTYLAGKTFIMITHRTSLLSLVDRLVLMDRGQIVADGPTQDIISRLSGSPTKQSV